MVTKEKQIYITEAEWEIMKVVWSNDEVTSRQVLDILSDKMGWSMSTIKTLLARLVEKNYLKTTKNGNQFIYAPKINEEDAINNLLTADLNKLCQKKKGKMIYQLIDKEELTIDDVTQLITLLSKKKENAPHQVECNCIVGQCNCHK
ncbi:CopY/TcrY family copper transport repressor [Vagococcus sp. JNUCC 83]